MTKKKAKPGKAKEKKARFVSYTNAPSRAKPSATDAALKKHRKRLTRFLVEAKLVLSEELYAQMAAAATELGKDDVAQYHRLYTAMHNRPWTEPR